MRVTHSKIIGKGGIHCDCCRKGLSKKKARIRLNRLSRRVHRQSLNMVLP